MQKFLSRLTALDWVLSGATLAYGIWDKSPLIAGVGVFGLLIAWYSPAKRLQAKIANSSLATRRRAKESAAAQAAIAAVAEDEGHVALAESTEAPIAPRTYASPLAGYSTMRIHANKHNRLRADSFNLYNNDKTVGFN